MRNDKRADEELAQERFVASAEGVIVHPSKKFEETGIEPEVFDLVAMGILKDDEKD